MRGATPWQATARELLADGKRSSWETEFLRNITSREVLTAKQTETLERIAAEPSVEEIAGRLKARIEQLAVDLVGEEPTYRGLHEWRFYPRGGLTVTIAGEKRGVWHDFASDKAGDALDLVTHIRGGEKADTIKWAKGWLGMPEHERPAPKPRPESIRESDTLATARRVWRESVPAQGTRVETYLGSRGLLLSADAPIRFHPHCPRGRNETLPAMVCLMTDPRTNEPCGVHRTFLRSDGNGKADGEPKKAMLGHAGVIRLVPDEDVTLGLGLAEGIETALAVMQHANWRPVWAASSAGGIARFQVLDGTDALTVFADRDDKGAGLKAAHACAERWVAAGREARIELPPNGADWLDALTPTQEAA